MNKELITATGIVSRILLLLTVVTIGVFGQKRRGEDDFRINGTIMTAYVGTDTFVSVKLQLRQ